MPSKPAGNSNQQTTSQTQVELPSWLTNASQNIVGQAQNYAQTLPNYTVAPITPAGQSNISALQSNVGSTNPNFNTAAAAATAGTTYQPQQVTPGFLSGANLQPYMNPYTQSVIDPTMALQDQARQQANNQSADLAARTGAFGGSRQGVAEGVNNAQSALYGAQLGGQLNAANFTQAQNAANLDLNRSLSAQQSNQTAGLQGANLNQTAAQNLGNITNQGQNAYITGVQGAMAGQTQLQQQQQAVNNAPWTDALQRLQMQEGAVGSVPYGQTQSTVGTGAGPTTNPWLTGLGAGLQTAGTVGQLYTAFSDRTAKTDIKRIGKDAETDLPIYSYRYKGDPKTYPKVVGPMAQDIEKKYPDQVGEISGKKVVGLSFLSGIMGRAKDGR